MGFAIGLDIFRECILNVLHHGFRIDFIDRNPRDSRPDSGAVSVAGHTFDFIGLDSQGGFFLLEFLRLGVKSLSESGILEKSVEFTGILHQTAHTLYIVRFKLRGFFQVSFLDRIEKSGDRGFGGFFVHRLAACQDQAARIRPVSRFIYFAPFVSL